MEPVSDEPTVEGPARRKASWSLKAIVEDVAGRPIDELQDPGRPVHPYLRSKGATASAPTPRPPVPSEDAYDPVGNLYPPLVGPIGREFHGAAHEHHPETLERHRPPTAADGRFLRTPGPFHRPERLYLHYLLLHMDRLGDSALRYLKLAVEEELAHRARVALAPSSEPTATTGAIVPEPAPPT